MQNVTESITAQIALLEAELADGTFATPEAHQYAAAFLAGLREALRLLDVNARNQHPTRSIRATALGHRETAMGKKAITFAEARKRGISGYLGWAGPDHPDHPLNRPWVMEGLFQSMKAEV